MKYAFLTSMLCITAATLQAQDPPAPFLLQSVEEKFTSDVAKAQGAVAKAEEELTKSRKVAADIRLKAYKDRLIEVTKSGDFDKAVAVKARIEQLEKEGKESKEAKEPEGDHADKTNSDKPEKIAKAKRPKPKDTVKFGGHTYALIKEKATWHVAKQRCEEMGGHLVCIDNAKEMAFIVDFCRSQKSSAWVGASDEEVEGAWRWLDGSPSPLTSQHVSRNANENENFLMFDLSLNDWNDAGAGRASYICEWDH